MVYYQETSVLENRISCNCFLWNKNDSLILMGIKQQTEYISQLYCQVKWSCIDLCYTFSLDIILLLGLYVGFGAQWIIDFMPLIQFIALILITSVTLQLVLLYSLIGMQCFCNDGKLQWHMLLILVNEKLVTLFSFNGLLPEFHNCRPFSGKF